MGIHLKEKISSFHMPTLIYEPNALEPVISKTVIDLHYGKHLKTYIDNLNTLAEDTKFCEMSIREIIQSAPEGPILNNAGEVMNHALYFEQFTPTPPVNNQPKGIIENALRFDLGNFDSLKKGMEKAAASLFGSGWVWLVQDGRGKLSIKSYHNGQCPLRDSLTPLYGIDMWEHAYYPDYRNSRTEYVQRLWDIIDWDLVESRMVV